MNTYPIHLMEKTLRRAGKLGLSLFLVLKSAAFCLAQNSPADYPNPNLIIPPSPNAASLGAYGEIPVGYYTGLPDISVPLYSIRIAGLDIPVSLSYRASGIKVEEVAPAVGLGWSLNAGGVVTRQMMGMPDESAIGYNRATTRQRLNQFITGAMTNGARDYLDNLADGTEDAEPDIFFFNCPGGTGKFFYDREANLVETPVRKNRILWGTHGGRQGWRITDVNGNDYYFLDQETTEYTSVFRLGSSTSVGTGPRSNQLMTSSWNLTMVVGANKADTVYFDYEGFTYSQRTIGHFTRYVDVAASSACLAPESGESYTNSSVSALRLKKIRFPGGTVDFTAGSAREDLPGDKVLQHIAVKNKAGQQLKSYTFSYHYTTTGSPLGVQYGKRLFLSGISISDGNLGKYSFAYNTLALPHRLSYNQDHWGYANNSSNGAVFTPTSYFANQSGGYIEIPGANKEIDTLYSQAGILTQITYPTGGNTRFFYENNTADGLPPDFDLKVGDKAMVFTLNSAGGATYFERTFEIKESLNSSDGVFARLTGDFGCTGGGPGGGGTFDCPDVRLIYPNGTSMQINANSYNKSYYLKKGVYRVTADYSFTPDPTGKIDNFRFVLTWPESFRDNPANARNAKVGGLRIKQIDTYDPSGNATYRKRYSYTRFGQPDVSSGSVINVPYYKYIITHQPYAGTTCDWLCLSSASNIGLGSTNGSVAGYAEVTEYFEENGQNGKKEYTFASPSEIPDYIYRGKPFPPAESRDFWRGTLKKEEVFAKSGSGYKRVREVINRYSAQTVPSASAGLGLKVMLSIISPGTIRQLNYYSTGTYSVPGGWSRLDTTVVRDFYDSGSTEQLTAYTQNTNNLLNSSTTLSKSDGSKEVTYTTYPQDYADGPGALKEMRDNYLLSYPVEQVRYREAGGTRTVLSGSITAYRAGGKGLVDRVLSLETPDPVPLASFKFSNRLTGQLPPSAGSNTAYSPDSRYRIRLTYNDYDSRGNLLQYTPSDGVPVSYVWGYGGQYPVAEIRNATRAQVSGTGFSQSVLDNTGSTEAQVAAQLDAIRSHAAMQKAQVSTYTYRPLYGMSSATDASGRTLRYEYDSSGRLLRIRDHQNNVVEEYNYHYRP